MSKNIIYASFSYKHHSKIAEYLFDKHQWKPVYWIGFKEIEKEIKAIFPDIVFHESLEVRRGRLINNFIDRALFPIDNKIIIDLSKYESTALEMMRRRDTTGWNFSYDERIQFYYKMLTYWNTVIHHVRPDIFVSWVIPHSAEEYILYQLCRYYKIPTLLVDAAPCLEKHFIVATSIEDKTSVFWYVYNSKEKLSISQDTKEYFKELKSPKGIIREDMEFTKYEYIKKQNEIKSRIMYFAKELMQLLKITIKIGIFAKSGNHFKCNKQSIESPASEMNYLQQFLFSMRVRKSNSKLHKIYSKHTIKPDLTKKYVYFAACYQPESTTSPDAGVYVDSFLILNILSRSIPSDWLIYFKEHPATFNVDFPGQGSMARNSEYYERVSSYDNVQMVSEDFNTFELIDKSIAVVTPTGTVGWEAVVRGKPALVFGQAWYVGCKSVFKINTYSDCIEAIKKIRDGYKPDQADIERYAAAIEQVAEKDLIITNFVKRTSNCMNLDFELQRIAKSIYRAYEENYL